MRIDFSERNPIIALHDVARLCRTRADQLARAHGMTRAQWVILLRLNHQPGMSQNELASLIEVEPITVGRLIDRLEVRGLVERRPDPNDRRVRRLHLTPAAEPLLDEIGEHLGALSAIVRKDVSPEALNAMMDCLSQMKTNLTAELREEKSA